MLGENKGLKMDLKKDQELDLQNVNLGFDSESEGKEEDLNDSDSEDSISNSEKQENLKQAQVQPDRKSNKSDNEGKSRSSINSSQSVMTKGSDGKRFGSLLGKNDEQMKVRLLEDAKESLQEAVINLTQALEKVDKFK